MMNLPLLFSAAELTGNQTFINMAISHANKTTDNHIRSDGSTYQVVAYNETTGTVIRRYAVQGYSDNSTWTRGQAWGIYGFAKMFNYTTQSQYLETSRRMANVFLARLPSSGVPPYDFGAPASNRPADTSAAMIAAEGLFILAEAEAYSKNATGAKYYKAQGVKLLINNFKFAFKSTWDSILSNGTSNAPQNNQNTGLVYGDYYALQAGNTMLKLGLASC
ncbi:glycoside hydrolase family 88 protein [Rhizoctonia solani]|uniref:Glycoside hydrolase family 88 protein n=1 Tax=Rhizoctonia solani TaxID=456999 RepID=A0A8H8P1G2_9AGAM|nr:glycoside hydrolase family 88 protein [Rhizoctonia solani]QRW22236.1 glycoside hydrolase family 88 protein [Rhizoctonia solani]